MDLSRVSPAEQNTGSLSGLERYHAYSLAGAPARGLPKRRCGREELGSFTIAGPGALSAADNYRGGPWR